jgi:hypothetical protein
MSNLLEKASIVLTPTAYSDGTLHSVKPLQTFGSELVTNGDFATDSDWAKGTGWTISGGTANQDGTNGILRQNNVVSTNTKVKATFDLTNYGGSGNLSIKFAPNTYPITLTGNGSYTVFTNGTNSTNGDLQIITSGGFVGSIDNVSVKEVINADFDFSRPTTGSATGIGSRENSSGNIESVAANLPRIDYLGGTGHILLEPQSTNTATYSNDFTQGVLFNGSSNPSTSSVLSANQSTSPDVTNTDNKLTENHDGGTGSITLNYNATNFTSGEASTVSMFVKKDTVRYFRIAIANLDTDVVTSFDLDTGLVNDGTGVMTDYGEGWYRCSVTTTTTTDLTGSVSFAISENSDRSGGNLRNGTKSTFLWGLQAEEQSFPTSYIPTSGSTVTRSADVCNNSGSSDLINSTEGVLYAEIAALADTETYRTISLNNGTNDECVRLRFHNSSNTINGLIRDEGSGLAQITFTVTDVRDFHKAAYKYKSGNCELWVDGVKRGTSTNTFSLSTQTQLNFNQGTATDIFYGKVKCVAVFKEALTDEELTCLTT